jgi:hypothetical protein
MVAFAFSVVFIRETLTARAYISTIRLHPIEPAKLS